MSNSYPFQCQEPPNLGGKLIPNAPIGKLSWLGVGGKADWLYQPGGIEDLCEFLPLINESTPVFVIGAGSNLIVRDGGFRGVVIRLGSSFTYIHVNQNTVRVGAFTKDSQVAKVASEHGIDLTFLRTIPGTLGGAVKMNAGCYGSYIADHFIEAKLVMRCGSIRTITKQDCSFGYRHCDVPDGGIIVEVLLEAQKNDASTLITKLEEYLDRRGKSQPTGTKTAGSTFRNPAGFSSTWDENDSHELKAWKLIDEVGLRGEKFGDAQVSEIHPNFLINTGEATAYQIEKLGEIVRQKVFEKKNIRLDWEIIRLGEFDKLKVEKFV